MQICMGRSAFEWSDLRLFLAIAREGTLGASGKRLGLSQPTMGRRLRALEEGIGHTLVQRTGEGLVLTDEGTMLLAHAERMEAEAIALERQLGAKNPDFDGLLRIASSDWFGAHMLAPVISGFLNVYPGVQVELLTDTRHYNLSRREADIAFRMIPFEEAEIVSRRLLRIEYGVYLKVGVPHPRPGDGTGTPLITMNVAFDGMADAVWLRRILPKATIAARSNNRDVQARLCAQGAGLAVLPRPIGDGLPGVERLSLGEPPPSRDTFIGYHRDMKKQARLRAFVSAAIATLRDPK